MNNKSFSSPPLPSPKIPASSIPEEWPALVREVVRREGRAIRGPLERAVIEIKSLRDNSWGLIMLPGNGTEFISIEDRDGILSKIEAK